jgi:hypothetical protein
VREARDEAKKEIDAYRTAKEEEFKKFEAEVSSTPYLLLSRPRLGSLDVMDMY